MVSPSLGASYPSRRARVARSATGSSNIALVTREFADSYCLDTHERGRVGMTSQRDQYELEVFDSNSMDWLEIPIEQIGSRTALADPFGKSPLHCTS